MSSSLDHKDLFLKIIVAVLSIVALIPVFSIVYELVIRGLPVITGAGLKFFTKTAPAPGDRLYGIGPALVGTVELALISTAIGIPIAFFTGVLIETFRESRISQIVNIIAKSLMEIPTVLIGMLVYILLVVPTKTFSIISGGIALALVMMPYTLTYIEESLNQVQYKYIEAGYGLGMNKKQVAFKVMVPIAKRGVVVGILIGITKALGETAPLLFTIGAARNTINWNPLEPGDAIPLLIFDYIQSPYDNMKDIAWGSALVLFVLFVILYSLIRLFVKRVRI